MGNEGIAGKTNIPVKQVDVFGSKMSYLEAGSGDAILFLHGIPTSSYVWRNIIPYLAPLGRCIAPDLIGFGRSDKPDIKYSISDHIKYIEKFIEVLGLKNVTLIMHGWGSIIGFHYATHHEKNCRGLVFYEAFLRSVNGDDLSLPFQEQMQTLQDLENASDMVTNGVTFIDRIMPQNIMRQLTDEEMKYYREPFQQAGTDKPILQYIRELPKGAGKTEVDKLIDAYSVRLTKSRLPKLMLYSVPGFITTMATVKWAKDHLPNLEIVDIGEELHLGQESSPGLIGEAISVWLQGVEQM
jgi:haloalkane dehalogenase